MNFNAFHCSLRLPPSRLHLKTKRGCDPSKVEQSMGYAHVLELKSRSYQIEPHEKGFAELVCGNERDDIFLGNTMAVDEFLLKQQAPIQLKRAGIGPASPPGGFVQAFLTAWQKSRGWRGISSLYISAPGITVEFARP